MGPNRVLLHAVETFIGEGQKQKFAGRHLVDPTGTQVKERVLFDLADGCAMRALYVVGIDFELRLGVDLCVVGKQKVAVGLLSIGLLCVFMHDNAAMENSVRMAVQNAVVEPTAITVWAGMFDQHVVVQMLAAVADEQTIDQALGAFASQDWVYVVAHKTATQQHGMRRDVGASPL